MEIEKFKGTDFTGKNKDSSKEIITQLDYIIIKVHDLSGSKVDGQIFLNKIKELLKHNDSLVYVRGLQIIGSFLIKFDDYFENYVILV